MGKSLIQKSDMSNKLGSLNRKRSAILKKLAEQRIRDEATRHFKAIRIQKESYKVLQRKEARHESSVLRHRAQKEKNEASKYESMLAKKRLN